MSSRPVALRPFGRSTHHPRRMPSGRSRSQARHLLLRTAVRRTGLLQPRGQWRLASQRRRRGWWLRTGPWPWYRRRHGRWQRMWAGCHRRSWGLLRCAHVVVWMTLALRHRCRRPSSTKFEPNGYGRLHGHCRKKLRHRNTDTAEPKSSPGPKSSPRLVLSFAILDRDRRHHNRT